MQTKTKQSEYKLLCSLIPHACLFHNENKLSIKTETRQSMYKLLCNLKPHHQLFHKRKQTHYQNQHSTVRVEAPLQLETPAPIDSTNENKL